MKELTSDKKMLTSADLVTLRAMEIVSPLYKNESGDVKSPTAEYILDFVCEKAAQQFLKDSGLYSSALFATVNDVYEGLPNLATELEFDSIAFYEKHKKSVIRDAELYCEKYAMDFYDIPGFDYTDRLIKTDANKEALAKFVLYETFCDLKDGIKNFRNDLEKIPDLFRDRRGDKNNLKPFIKNVQQEQEILK